MDDVIKIVRNATNLTLEVQNKMLSDYFPGKGNGGIHEFNVVSTFIESLKRELGYENISAWSEVLCLKSDKNRPARLDAAIKLCSKDSLLILEAKRIRQGKTKGKPNSELAIKSILRDSKRLAKLNESEPIISKSNSKNIYRVLLASMWISENKEMNIARQKWMQKQAFSEDWLSCYVYETNENESKKQLKLLLAIDGPYNSNNEANK